MQRRFISFFLASQLFALAPAFAQAQDARDQFFATMQSLCGQQFEGVLV